MVAWLSLLLQLLDLVYRLIQWLWKQKVPVGCN